MAKSERKKLVSFADVRVEPDPGMQGFNQLTFDALSSPEQEMREIENLLIIKPPHIKKVNGGHEWGCTVEYQRDLWHQEEYGVFVLHASQTADLAAGLKLKQRDLIKVRGVPWTQEVTLRGGRVHEVQHINVQDIEVMKRAPRVSTRRRS